MMETDQAADRTLSSRYETVFCVFMAALAYLWRDNPDLAYPQILHAFLLLLALNLAAGLSLRLWPARKWISALFILANCGTITSVLNYSGGMGSNLWALYLLPIHTVCLLLGPWEVVWITAGAIGLNAIFPAFEASRWDGGVLFELLLKSAVFIFTAAITWKIADRDRGAREKLKLRRLEVQRLGGLLDLQGARLEEAEKTAEVGPLSSALAHDLNNVFTAVLGFIEIASQGDSLAQDTREDLRSIRESIQRGQGLVAAFARLARKPRLPLVACDVRDLLRSALSPLNGALAGSDIKLDLKWGNELPVVMASRAHLQRLLANLIRNAMRAMRHGGVLALGAEAVERVGCKTPQIRIDITDSGPGIPEEILANLFKPLAAAQKSRSSADPALYACWEIAMQHGGTLRAENVPQGGAKFTLLLPAAAQTASQRGPKARALPAALAGLFLACNAAAASGDFKRAAHEFSRASVKAHLLHVAVLPFVSIDGHASAGGDLSEHFITQLVRTNRVRVVERSLLGKLLEERHLYKTGLLDPGTLRKLGGLFSVEGIVTGSLALSNQEAVVNARLIDVASGVIIAAARIPLGKEWRGASMPKAQARDHPPRISLSALEPAPDPVARPPDDFADLRDAPGKPFCAMLRARVDRMERRVLELKARYWALQLKNGGSMLRAAVFPGSTISDIDLQQTLYDGIHDWYARGDIPALTPSETEALLDMDRKVLSLREGCPARDASAAGGSAGDGENI